MICRNLLRVGGLFCLAILAVALARAVPARQEVLPVKTHEVMVIYRADADPPEAKVAPGVLKVRAGDAVNLFTRGTEASAYMMYRKAFSRDGVVLPTNQFEVATGDTVTLGIMYAEYLDAPWDSSEHVWDAYWKDRGLPRTVPYPVYCHEARAFAEGYSTPIIIIEPPDDDD